MIENLKRPVWAAIFLGLFALAFIAVVGPSDFAWTHGFMINGGGASAVGGHPLALGDHLQSTYYMWLWWHSMTTGSHLPWSDPYQFALTGHHVLAVAGWPLVLVFLPVMAIAGPIAAFNTVVIASFVATAICMYLLARQLGFSRVASTVASLAFAFAPFRLIQLGHFGTLVGFFPPLILYLADKAIRGTEHNARWAWGCAVAFVSLVASGELHLVLYVGPLFVTFVAVRAIGVPRERLRALVPAGAALIVVSAVVLGAIYHFVLSPSSDAPNGVSVEFAQHYAPRIANFFHPTTGGEQYDYPGVVIVLLGALAVISVFVQSTKRRLLIWAICVVGVSYLVALLPGWGPAFNLMRQLPMTGFIRVPGRILIDAAVGLALLAGFGAQILERRWRGFVLLPLIGVLLIADVHLASGGFKYTTAGSDVESALPVDAPVMDLPPFQPGHFGASRYMLDIVRHPADRANGYDVLAPKEVWEAVAQEYDLTKLPVDVCRWKRLTTNMHFTYVAVHADLFGTFPYWPEARPHLAPTAAALNDALVHTPGFHQVSTIDDVTVFRVDPAALRCSAARP